MFVSLPPEMIRVSGFLNPNKNFFLLIKAVLNFCLLVLVGFSFGQQQPVSPSAHSFSKNCRHQKEPLLYSADFFNTAHFPFSNPFITQLISEEVEISDDMAAADDSEITWSSLFQSPFADKRFGLGPQKNLFIQLAQSVQNRTTASLFVLHHSWKSFLV